MPRKKLRAGCEKNLRASTKLFFALHDNQYAMRKSALITGAAGVAVTALTWAAIATARGLPATLPHHLLLYVAAGLAWAVAALIVPGVCRRRARSS